MAGETIISSTRVVLLGVVLVTLGSIGFHAIPGLIDEEAAGARWVNSLYCCVITLTTVSSSGYAKKKTGRIVCLIIAAMPPFLPAFRWGSVTFVLPKFRT